MASTYQLIKHSFDIAEAFRAIFQRRKSFENVQTIDASRRRRRGGHGVAELALPAELAEDHFRFCRLLVDVPGDAEDALGAAVGGQPGR
jgi:hypothetical protein